MPANSLIRPWVFVHFSCKTIPVKVPPSVCMIVPAQGPGVIVGEVRFLAASCTPRREQAAA